MKNVLQSTLRSFGLGTGLFKNITVQYFGFSVDLHHGNERKSVLWHKMRYKNELELQLIIIFIIN